MEGLSSVNQQFIQQQALNPAPPVSVNPVPSYNPQPQVDLSQEPDVFVPSNPPKKSHKKAIIGIGSLLVAGAGLYALVKTGKLSFTGKGRQNLENAIPDDILKLKDDVLASVPAVREKGRVLVEQSREAVAKADEIQASAKQEFDEVLNLIQNAAANNFENSGNIRFHDMPTKPNRVALRSMEELDGDNIVRRTLFNISDFKDIRNIEKGVASSAEGETVAEKFSFYEGKLSTYVKGLQKLPDNASKADEEFNFSKGQLSSWYKNYLDEKNLRSYDEVMYFLDGGHISWNKGYKEKEEIIEGVKTKIETTAERMSLSLEEENPVSNYSTGEERISRFVDDGIKSSSKLAEEFDFSETGKMHTWTKGFEMDEANNQKRAYTIYFDEGEPSSMTVNSTGILEQEAYYDFKPL